MMRPIAVLGLLLLVSACASPLQKLKELNPSADDFPSSLAAEYLAYADSEGEQGRKFVAEIYANKGLKVLKGETVEPEAPDTSLPAADQQDLAAARVKLMALLTDEMKHAAPQKLARAQLLFDCWQHELARRINQENAPCADGFSSAIREVQDIADALVYNDITEYSVDFAKHHSKLSNANLATIKGIAHNVAHNAHYKIELDGHAGLESAQQKLLAERLAAVHDALVAAGIPEQHIQLWASHSVVNNTKEVKLSCDVEKEDDNGITIILKLHKLS